MRHRESLRIEMWNLRDVHALNFYGVIGVGVIGFCGAFLCFEQREE